jgi:hypothetical protein
MDFAPKNLEELMVYAALLGLAALWRAHVKEKSRCEKANLDMQSEIRDLRLSQLSEARAMADRGEERERLLAVMVDKVTLALDQQRELVKKAFGALKRYDADPTPRPGERDSSALYIKPHDQRDDETSAIFREEMRHR